MTPKRSVRDHLGRGKRRFPESPMTGVAPEAAPVISRNEIIASIRSVLDAPLEPRLKLDTIRIYLDVVVGHGL